MSAPAENNLAGYDAYPPSPALEPFVQRFLHGYTRSDEPHRITIPPSSGMFLSYVDGAPIDVHFSDRRHDARPTLFIGGQLRRESPILESRGRFGLIGTEFTPTGFHRLFKLDASAFTDDMTDFAAIRPAEAESLATRLPLLPDAGARIEALDTYLLSLVDGALPATMADEAIAHLIAERGQVSIETLAAKTGVGPRHLRREFLRVVGIGPKHAAKIIQLSTVVSALLGPNPVRLGACAADCGYFDQSHFIRDFKRYVGANPVAFLRDEEAFLRQYLGKQSAR